LHVVPRRRLLRAAADAAARAPPGALAPPPAQEWHALHDWAHGGRLSGAQTHPHAVSVTSHVEPPFA
jgi:hypothetical protein